LQPHPSLHTHLLASQHDTATLYISYHHDHPSLTHTDSPHAYAISTWHDPEGSSLIWTPPFFLYMHMPLPYCYRRTPPTPSLALVCAPLHDNHEMGTLNAYFVVIVHMGLVD
jgi:hypothetical protein